MKSNFRKMGEIRKIDVGAECVFVFMFMFVFVFVTILITWISQYIRKK